MKLQNHKQSIYFVATTTSIKRNASPNPSVGFRRHPLLWRAGKATARCLAYNPRHHKPRILHRRRAISGDIKPTGLISDASGGYGSASYLLLTNSDADHLAS